MYRCSGRATMRAGGILALHTTHISSQAPPCCCCEGVYHIVQLGVLQQPSCPWCRSGCWWRFDGAQSNHVWTLLIQGAAPCSGFRTFMQSNSSTAGTASKAGTAGTVETTGQAVQLLSSIKGWRGEAADSQSESQNGKQTWLLSMRHDRDISLWVRGDPEIELTAEVSTISLVLHM